MFNLSLNLYNFLLSASIATIIIFIRQLLLYKQIIDKDLRLIKTYLDKKLLYKMIITRHDTYSALITVKSQLQLEEAKLMSFKELEEDEELMKLFQAELDSYKADSSDDEPTIVMNKIEGNITHKLFVFSEETNVNDNPEQALIYVKIPYRMDKSEKETLYTFIHLAKMM